MRKLVIIMFLVILFLSACVLVISPVEDGGYQVGFGTKERTSSPTPTEIAESPKTSNAPIANANFDKNTLSAETRLWLDRLYAALDHPKVYPPIETYVSVADTYWSARAADQRLTALSMALRATGDPELLERIYIITELARNGLHQRNDYMVFLDQTIYCPPVEKNPAIHKLFCNKDKASVNETLVFGSVAHWTYVLWSNAQFDARYAEAANFWILWLESHLDKWDERKDYLPELQRLEKSLYHCYSAMLRGYYYLGIMTGNDDYVAEAQRRANVLIDMMYYENDRWLVDHRVVGFGKESLYPHPTPYYFHSMGMWIDLALNDFTPLTDEIMQRWALTLSRVIKNNELFYYLDSDGAKVTWTKYTISTAVGLALWDESGYILRRTAAIQAQESQPERQPMIYGAMVYVSAQQLQPLSFGLIAEEKEVYALLYTDGSWSTVTPAIAATPTATPTETQTPRPTSTPTLVPEATPTQETTPLPPITPEPPIHSCTLRAVLTSVRVRSGPGTEYEELGRLAQGFEYQSTLFKQEDDYLWMQHSGNQQSDPITPAGWSAIYSYATSSWWVAGTPDSDICIDVPGWDQTLLPPPAIAYRPTAIGNHNVLPEKNPGGLWRALASLAQRGIRPALFNVETTTAMYDVRAVGGDVALRKIANDGHVGDCPTGEGNPLEAATEIVRRTQAYFWTNANPTTGIYISVDNECKVFWENLAWTDVYLSETIKLFGEMGFRMVVANTFAGDWTLEYVLGLPKTWAAMRKYDSILGLHAYGVLPGKWVSYAIDSLSEPWLNPFGGQHVELREWLIQQHPLNVYIPFWYTEVGTSTGGEQFIPEDCPAWYHKVKNSNVGIMAMTCWTAGRGTTPESGDDWLEYAASLY